MNAQIWIENEQSMVKRQIEGSNDDEILWISYPQKSDETKNLMKPKSNDLDLRSGRNPCFKINKIPHPNLGETKNNSISKMKLTI